MSTLLEDAIISVDKNLKDVGGRSMVSGIEVSNMLLDVRSYLARVRELENLSEKGVQPVGSSV